MKALPLLLALFPSVAWAQDFEEEAPPAVVSAVQDGQMLPFSVSAKSGAQPALVSVQSGYDSSRRTALLKGATEVRLYGPLALRASATYVDARDSLRPSFGLKVQALRQARHGVDGAIAVEYKPEGFTEAEGEIEAVFAVARRWGAFTGIANLVYGQDPEASERDGEVRLSGLYAFSPRVTAGMDLRLRFDLGSEPGKRRAKLEASYDLVAGPTVAYGVGPVALLAFAGASVIDVAGTQVGALALGGFGFTL